MGLTEFFDDPAHLSRIDWEVMQSQYWHDTDHDPDRKRRRQAEFLVHAFVPWQLIIGIGVSDDVMKVRAEQMMQAAEHQPPVKVLPKWYY
ncbi:MAG: DUF4433 domain-containing protein [Chloroflexota bacterium]|nr:DUF4433 domain-containing protein [Chloroflexota bacterium]